MKIFLLIDACHKNRLTLVWFFVTHPWWCETAPSSGCSHLYSLPAAAVKSGWMNLHAAALPRFLPETETINRRFITAEVHISKTSSSVVPQMLTDGQVKETDEKVKRLWFVL